MITEQQEREAKPVLGNASSALMIAQSLDVAQTDVATLLASVRNENTPHELQAFFLCMIFLDIYAAIQDGNSSRIVFFIYEFV